MAGEAEDRTVVSKAHKQVIDLKGHPTASVTIYPNSAAIVREIKDVSLKPGLNEIHINHITALSNENSIQVSGTHTSSYDSENIVIIGTKTDIFQPQNSGLFGAAAPLLEPVCSDEGDEKEEEASEEEKEQEEKINKLKDEASQLKTEITKCEEKILTAKAQVVFLGDYGKTLANNPEVEMETVVTFLGFYAQTRLELGAQVAKVEHEINALQKQRDKIVAKAEKKSARHQRVKDEKSAKKQLKRREKKWLKDTDDDREAEEFNYGWRRVVVTVEGPGLQEKEGISGKTRETKMDLCLKYSLQTAPYSFGTFSYAGWKPSYDITVDTTEPQASNLAYRAIFWNSSQETWKNARITLSASQTIAAYGSVIVPALEPWKLSVRKQNEYDLERTKKKEMYSNQERNWRKQRPLGGVRFGGALQQHQPQLPPQPQQPQLQQQQHQRQLPLQQLQSLTLYGNNAEAEADSDDSDGDDGQSDTETISTLYMANAIRSSKSHTTSHGQTTAHILPHVFTIPPSAYALDRKQTINPDIPLNEIQLSYITVPKLSPVAYLRAKIRNTSNLVWLKGQAGITLDGSYLGSSLTMPTCEIGQVINLTLGVDESVKVIYGKVGKKRSKESKQGGIFGTGKKEEWDKEVYERSIDVWNFKHGVATSTGNSKSEVSSSGSGKGKIVIEVLDQIPVSEDENLHVSLLNPRIPWVPSTISGTSTPSSSSKSSASASDGFSTEVPTGTPLGNVKKGESWGRAMVKVYWKTGLVVWRVELEPGRGVRLGLEYEVRCPVGDVAFAV